MLVDVQEEAKLAAAAAPRLSALQASAREDEISDWMDDHDVDDGWERAPVLVVGGTSIECLDKGFIVRLPMTERQDTSWLGTFARNNPGGPPPGGRPPNRWL